MTDDESAVVEAMGQVLGSSGMTPMAGRVWGWLLICEPAEQTAEQLAHELHASRGSISGAARLLATAGLIRRTTKPGDRKEYFSIPPGSLTTLTNGAVASYRRGREIAEQGVAILRDRPPAVRARVEEVRDTYAYLEREFPAFLERFHEQQLASRVRATKRKGKKRAAV